MMKQVDTANLIRLLFNRSSGAVAKVGDHLAMVTWAEKWGLLCPLPCDVEELQHNVAWAEADPYTKWHPDPSSRLATIDMGRGLYGRMQA